MNDRPPLGREGTESGLCSLRAAAGRPTASPPSCILEPAPDGATRPPTDGSDWRGFRVASRDDQCVVAMSGGVDSAVAALLAVRASRCAAAFTLRLVDAPREGGGKGRCCAPADVRDARRVAARLGLPYYVL